MEEIKVYNKGALIYSAPITDAAERAQALQQYNYVSLDWIAAESKPIPANSYIDFEGTRFFNEDDYWPEREDNYYHYQMTFHAIEDTFNRPLFFRYVNITDQSTGAVHTWKEPEFDLNGNLKTIADIIVTSLNMAGYDVYFKLPAANKYKETELKAYSFASVSIAEAMATVADMNETEWWVEPTTEMHEGKPVVLLHFDKCEYGDNIELSDEYYQEDGVWKSKGLTKIEQPGKGNIIPSKLYVYGSERNIIKKTVQEMVDGGLMNVSYAKKLRIPEGKRTIYSEALKTNLLMDGSDSSITIEGIDNGFEAAKIFDEIYPKMTMTITEVQVLNPNSDNPIYYLNADKLKSLNTAAPADDAINPGRLGLLIEGTTLMCTFTSGLLNGFEFECAWRESTAQIGLVPNQDNDVQIPYGNFIPKVGDKFILWNLAMPKTAVTDAQEELLTEAVTYIEDLALTMPDTRCATDSEYFHQTGIKIKVGQRYTLYSDVFKDNKLPSRCTQYSYSLARPYDIDFTIASAIAKGRLAKIENQISDVTAEVDTVGQTQRSISRRQWHDVEEMKQMIDAIETQMVVVGYEQDAFIFTNVISYDQDTKILSVGKGYLQHQVYTDNEWEGVWLVADKFQQDMNVADPEGTTPYYIYIKCSKSADTASIYLTDLKVNYDQPESYYFLAGILSSEFEGNRVFNQTSGLTSIAGGTITTEVIQDAARKLIIDFSNQRIIARNGAEIVGAIKYIGADGSAKDIANIADDMANYNRLADTYKQTFYQTDTPTTYYLQPTVPLIPNADYLFSVEKITWQPQTQGDPQGSHYEIGVKTGSDYKTLKVINYSDEQRAVIKMPNNVNASSQFVLIFNGDFTGGYGNNIFEKFKLAEGSIYTGWSAASPDEYTALRLVNGAIQDGSTEIDGGMVMTNVLMLKDMLNNVQAGMSGITNYKGIEDKVLLWGGGSYQAAQDAANGKAKLPILLTKKGYGSTIGLFNVNEDNVTIKSNDREVIFTTKKMDEMQLDINQQSVTGAEVNVGFGEEITLRKDGKYKVYLENTTLSVYVSGYRLMKGEGLGATPPQKAYNGTLSLDITVQLNYGEITEELFHRREVVQKYTDMEWTEYEDTIAIGSLTKIEQLKEGTKASIYVRCIATLGGNTVGTANLSVHGGSKVKATFEEIFPITLIASDGMMISQSSKNKFSVKTGINETLWFDMEGYLPSWLGGNVQGKLHVGEGDVLKFK